jgi:hypothetical protein
LVFLDAMKMLPLAPWRLGSHQGNQTMAAWY